MNLFNMLGDTYTVPGLINFTNSVKTYLNYAVMGVIGLFGLCAIIFAVWVAFRLAKAEDEQKRKEAKNQLIWSIVGVVAAILIYILVLTVFNEAVFGYKKVGDTGYEPVAHEVNIVLGLIGEAFGILSGLGALAGVAFGVYIAYRLATAQDEQKRKQAKAQLMWTVVAVFAVFVLSAVISQVMGSLAGYLG